MNKKALVQQLVSQLEEEHTRAIESAAITAKGAVHEESKAEGSKDTRSIEASYLARGQASRVEELSEAVDRIRFMDVLQFDEETPIGSSAVVCVVHEDETAHWYFVVPVAGGRTLQWEGEPITTITPRSPLGRGMVEKNQGEVLELSIGGKTQELELVSVL